MSSLCSSIIFLFSTCPLVVNAIDLLSPLFSQGSVFEGTVYGLEAYSRYSLKVEALNGAGGLIMNTYANELGINCGSWAGDR